MADEIRTIQSAKTKALDSEAQSSRSSIDSNLSRARLGSPAPKSRAGPGALMDTPHGPGAAPIDFVYLKNVLLQFLEQKDKKHQQQLIPVLGMLLHFDRYDAPLCPQFGVYDDADRYIGKTNKNGCRPLSANEAFPDPTVGVHRPDSHGRSINIDCSRSAPVLLLDVDYISICGQGLRAERSCSGDEACRVVITCSIRFGCLGLGIGVDRVDDDRAAFGR